MWRSEKFVNLLCTYRGPKRKNHAITEKNIYTSLSTFEEGDLAFWQRKMKETGLNWFHELFYQEGERRKRLYAGQIPKLFPRQLIGRGDFNLVLEGDDMPGGQPTVWKYPHHNRLYGESLEEEDKILKYIQNLENGMSKDFVPKTYGIQEKEIVNFFGPDSECRYDPTKPPKKERIKKVKVLVLERIDDEYVSLYDLDNEKKKQVAKKLAHIFYSLCKDGIQYKDGDVPFVVNQDNVRVNKYNISDIKLIDFGFAHIAKTQEICMKRLNEISPDSSGFHATFIEEFLNIRQKNIQSHSQHSSQPS